MSKPPAAKFRSARTLGPVADLESHLPAEWWRELFDSLYLKTDGDVVENDTNTQRDIDALITATGIVPEDRLLDLCCGQGRHSLALAARGYRHVTGFDRSRYLIRLAKRRAKTMGLNAHFHEGDARKPRFPADSFDCVFVMGNSFGYFDREDDDKAVIEAVKKILRSGGALALDITDGDWIRANYERRSWEWIDQNHFVCRERSLSSHQQRLITREVVTHAERGVIADQFYAERLFSREQITGLLDTCGFHQVRFHGTLEADSDRGQDLGMMANRLFITSVAPRKTAVQRPAKKAPVTVTVVMGDPRLPDPVKKGGKFNPEDFETINRLKEALATIEGYTFNYLDNHATLYNDLRSRQPDLILNLCDEGFNNDAFLELHVPAMLEMIGIPYTGAGPACLGMCYDKALSRAVAVALDLPVPLETYIKADDQSATLPSVFPALMKPAFGDSSIGITKDAVVNSSEEMVDYLTGLRKILPGRPVLVQEYLSGSEYTVSLIGNPGFGLEALPVLEVDYSGLDANLPKILGYESKWLPDSPYWNQIKYRPARLEINIERNLIENSMTLFERLRCRDYARFDFRADANGAIKLLEVNPNPGWCWDGKMNLMAEFAGMTYADLLRMIIDAAYKRYYANGKLEWALAPAA
jgi:D-alanine-D-alanine ligase